MDWDSKRIKKIQENKIKIKEIVEQHKFENWIFKNYSDLKKLFEVLKQNEFKDYNNNDIIQNIDLIDFCGFVYDTSLV